MKLSRLLDEKAKMLTSSGQQINENMLLAMIGLLIADDLTEARKGAAKSPVMETAPSNQPEVQIVEKVVEKFIEPDLTSTDNELAAVLADVSRQINAAAAEIEKL